jgi:serine/threonine protein kinase
MQLFRWKEKHHHHHHHHEESESTLKKSEEKENTETDFDTSVGVLYESFKTWCRLQRKCIVSMNVKFDMMTSQHQNEKYPDQFQLLHYGSRDKDSYEVGVGKYSKVYGRGNYAYKIVKTGYQRGKEEIGSLRCNLKELCFFHSMNHKNIMHSFQSQCIMEHGLFKKLIHEMPHARNTLENIITAREIPCYSEFWRIFRGVAEGLLYMHKHNIVHGDLKPSNIMIHDGNPLVSDFTLTNFEKKGNEMSFGTLYWRAPETLCQKAYGKPADVWAFGIMLLDCLYGCYYLKDIMKADNNMEVLSSLKYIIGLPDEKWFQNNDMSDVYGLDAQYDDVVISHIQNHDIQIVLSELQLTPLRDLIGKILLWNPEERLSFQEILDHPFFTPITKSKEPPSYFPQKEKVWNIFWKDDSEKEILTKSAKYIYHETFRTATPSGLDWLTKDVVFLAKRLIDHLKNMQVTFNTTQITRNAAYFFYFFYLDFYPDDPQFECIVYHILHLLEFNVFILNPVEHFLDQKPKEDLVVRLPSMNLFGKSKGIGDFSQCVTDHLPCVADEEDIIYNIKVNNDS